MVRIALDPTPYNDTVALTDFPDLAARLGYEYLQLTPNPDFGRHFHYPKLDDALVATLKRRARDAGVTITSLLPVQRFSWPEEPQRAAAVRNMTRYIELAAELGVPVVNTEFSGRPEREEDSEAGFYRSMAELIPVLEREGVTLNIDPHPDDFVEDGLEAWRVIRGLNTARVGFVYVAAHSFHMGDRAATLLPEIGDRLGAVYASDTLDHTRSNALRYITNPPGNAVRVHQHLAIGDGDVNWDELFGTLRATGYLDREDALIVSNVFAEDERADEISRFQLARIRELVAG
ncbi:sugar phosphate isomerase/epimerase family protein [Leucobacter luti]|uniref:Myo-inositol catabolism protein IolH n=1 Tax=Leucobacter luti TaxID=340320 RepID=A0A4V6MD59_9MICO|nr:sugar phosphate isomerase/epimerase family protein [Leucobacter luti]MBL3699419.1 sugar phosphate isomerase/epimerase [Leucobacter luti]RZT66929.1 myo-inositol catabolism protein IolH [Leucobacter luti]